jgi:hypothetical protein
MIEMAGGWLRDDCNLKVDESPDEAPGQGSSVVPFMLSGWRTFKISLSRCHGS